MEFRKLLKESRPLSHKRDGYDALSRLYAYRGQYRKTLEFLGKVGEIDLKLGDTGHLATTYCRQAFWWLFGWNDVEHAEEAIKRGLELEKFGDWFFYASLLYPSLFLGEYEQAFSVAKKVGVFPFIDIVVKAHLHQTRGELDDAIRDFQTVTQKGFAWPKVRSHYDLAECYLEMSQFDQAIESAIKIHKRRNRIPFDKPITEEIRAAIYPRSFNLLGKIYEKKGDTQLAIQNYEKFLDLWKNADEDLPDLIDAKKRLAKLKEMSNKGN